MAIDSEHHRAFLLRGGTKTLTVFALDTHKAIDAHPEFFQLEKDSSRIYVNLPKSRNIAVVDRDKRTILATWPLGLMLALDQADHRLFAITRYPARLFAFDTTTGKTVQRLPAAGDCHDVFYDKARKRIYAIGGEGAISVFEQQDPDHYKESARITTVKGARQVFFHPNLTAYFWLLFPTNVS
jgi:hypothetical protein